MTSTERVICAEPCIIRRRVRFGDCDPAGVVYTVRFADYAVSAMDLFLSLLLDGPFLEQLSPLQTPIKALNFVFSAPLRPNDEFDMTVAVSEIRARTFDLAIAGTLPSGERAFDVVLTPICIMIDATERRSLPLPDRLRSLLTQYQQRTTADASSLPN